MPNHRFFSPEKLATGQLITLDKALSNHIHKVLRLGDGDDIILFDGDGYDYKALLASDGRRLIATVQAAVQNKAESPVITHLGQAMCRGDRMDYSLQKAVETGVHIITPLISERVQFRLDAKRLAKKMQHWRGIIISACEQSGRATLPELHAPSSLEDWLSESNEITLMLAPEAKQSLAEVLTGLTEEPPGSLRLAIGPEGGFSQSELDAAVTTTRCRLGPRILRTETAGTAVLALIQNYLGDY